MNLPKWFGRDELDNAKDEQNWAKRRGGRTQINSGRLWFAKGDTKDTEFLSDAKETERGSYRISREEWLRLRSWAMAEHRVPCLKIKLIGSPNIELVVLPADVLG